MKYVRRYLPGAPDWRDQVTQNARCIGIHFGGYFMVIKRDYVRNTISYGVGGGNVEVKLC